MSTPVFTPDPSTSATGGYLRPMEREVEDKAFEDFLQAWLVGLTGLNKDWGVVPAFQPEPPPQRDNGQSWLAFNINDANPDAHPFQQHIPGSGVIAIVFIDATTGAKFTLQVVDGELIVIPGGLPGFIASGWIGLSDTVTGDPFTLYVANGQLKVAAGGGGGTTITLIDGGNQETWNLVVTNGQLQVVAGKAVPGSTVQLQAEEIELQCFAYGPRARQIWASIWNNAWIGQNQEPLFGQQLRLKTIGKPLQASEYVNEEWVQRADFTITLRRAVTLTYPIEDVASGEFTIVSDAPPLEIEVDVEPD